jgi:hypothetical protein
MTSSRFKGHHDGLYDAKSASANSCSCFPVNDQSLPEDVS